MTAAGWATPEQLEARTLAELEDDFASISRQPSMLMPQVATDIVDTRSALYDAIERKKNAPRCPADEEPLVYVAEYGAPGRGYHGRCPVCKRDYAVVGGVPHDPAAQAHILSPDDVA